MGDFSNYKKFENVGIRSSNDTLIVMDSTNNNISLHSSDGGGDNVDTLSIKNIINKTPNMDLNLSSLTGTTINPVITINNNNQDCRINTNLNVNGNINLTNGGILKTTGIGSFGSINCGVGTFTNIDSGSGSFGTVTANTFSGTLSGNAATATKLATTRSIGGVSFDGTTNINLPGVNTSGTQNTSGNAATATAASNVQIANFSDYNQIGYIPFAAGYGGATYDLRGDSGLYYAPSSNTLYAAKLNASTSTQTTKLWISGIHELAKSTNEMLKFIAYAGSSSNFRIQSHGSAINFYARISFGTYYVSAHIQMKGQTFESSVAISNSSDDRIKIDEELIINVTPILLRLRPQKYKKYTGDTIDEVKKLIEEKSSKYIIESGLIAQEIFYEVPELRFLVNHSVDENLADNISRDFTDIKNDPDYSNWSNEISSVNYTGLIPYLIRGFQEQHTEIALLKTGNQQQQSKVNILETENQQQQTKINTLETDVSTLKTENAELKSIIDKLKTANSFEEFKNTF